MPHHTILYVFKKVWGSGFRWFDMCHFVAGLILKEPYEKVTQWNSNTSQKTNNLNKKNKIK